MSLIDDPRTPTQPSPLSPDERSRTSRKPAWAATAHRYLLPVWFAIGTIATIYVVVSTGGIGGDAVIYHRASSAWLAGGNPWDASIPSVRGEIQFHFYALPTAVVLLAPFAVLPESWVPAIGVGIQAISAIYAIRRLGLGWWWLIFPPVVSGVLSGNPSILLLALLIAPSPIANAVGPLLKVYGGVPLLADRRIRALAITSAVTLLTFALFPDLWRQFLFGALHRERMLMLESAGGFSAFRFPVLLLGAVAALLIIARDNLRAAGWLLPITIWPASQFHWATLALPVLPLWALMPLALHYQQLPPVVVMAYAVAVQWRRMRTPATFDVPVAPFAPGGIGRVVPAAESER